MSSLAEENEIDISTLLDELRNEIIESDFSYGASSSTKTDPPFKLWNVFKSNKVVPENLVDDPDSENTKNYNYLNLSESKKLEKDIEEMKQELKKSQEFFNSARDGLEAINFQNLKYRIEDLHLYPDHPDVGMIIENLVKKKDFDENFTKLTKIMGDKFKEHPGEFADIPEMSSFFKICTQLQKGLDDLDKKKTDFNSLGKRIVWATNVTENRSKDIQKLLSEQKKVSSVFQDDQV